MACAIVTSSAYSISLPAGTPVAMRVMRTLNSRSVPGQPARRRLAFQGWAGGHNHLVHFAALHPLHEDRPRSCSGPTPWSGDKVPCST